jgi:hypothetical protein
MKSEKKEVRKSIKYAVLQQIMQHTGQSQQASVEVRHRKGCQTMNQRSPWKVH